MPQENFVKWIITDYEYFHAMEVKDPSTLYFLKDTFEIYKGEDPYTRSAVKVNSANEFPEYGGNTLYIYDNKLYMHNGLSWEVVLDASNGGGGGEPGEPITILSNINPDNLTGHAVSDKAVVDYINSLPTPDVDPTPVTDTINPDDLSGEAVSDRAVVDYVTDCINNLPIPEDEPALETINPDDLSGEAVSDRAVVDYINSLPTPSVEPDTASTVKTTTDITVAAATGRYKAGEVIPKGTSIEEIITAMTSAAVVYKKPTLSVSYNPNISTVEAGSSTNITVQPVFTQNDGGNVTLVTITATVDGAVSTVYSGAELAARTVTIAPTTTNTVTIKTVVSYAAGVDATAVPASSLTATKTITVTAVEPDVPPVDPGVTYVYYTADTNKGEEITAESVVGFDRLDSSEKEFEIDCVTDTNRVVIAVPGTMKVKKITSSNLGYNVLTTFAQSTLTINSTEYKLYVYETDIPFPADDIYEVTLA